MNISSISSTYQILFSRQNFLSSLSPTQKIIVNIAVAALTLLTASCLLYRYWSHKKMWPINYPNPLSKIASPMNPLIIPQRKEHVIPAIMNTQLEIAQPSINEAIQSQESSSEELSEVVVELSRRIFSLVHKDQLEEIPDLLNKLLNMKITNFEFLNDPLKKLSSQNKIAFEFIVKTAIKIQPYNLVFRLQYSDWLREQDRFAESEKEYEELFSNYSYVTLKALSHYGDVLSVQKKIDDAEKVFNLAMEKSNQERYCLFTHYAQHLIDQNNHEEAERILEEFLMSFVVPPFLDIYVVVLNERREYEKLKKYLEKQLKHLPDHVPALDAYLRVLYQLRSPKNNIMNVVKKLLQFQPDNQEWLNFYNNLRVNTGS